MDAGRSNEALRLYQLASIRALDASAPVRDVLHAPIAHAYAALGRGDLAKDYLARALDVDQDAFLLANTYTWAEDTYALTGHLDKAHSHAEVALRTFPAGSQRPALLAEVTLAELHRRTDEQDAEQLIAGCWQRAEGTACARGNA